MDPLTEELPFLVVHGDHVWKALLIASTAAACALGWLLRWRAARARRRDTLAHLERRAREGEVVLHGTLGGTGDTDGAATLRGLGTGGEHATASWRTGELWVETEDKRVRLDGEICVTAGSRAAAARNGVPSLVGDAHLEAARANAPWLHRIRGFHRADTDKATADAVGPGDRVAVRGCLSRAPSAEPSGYRDAEVTWVLRPHGDGPAIELAACKPAAPILRMARGALVMAIGCTALLSWCTMRSLGESWSGRCIAKEARQTADGPLEVTNTHVCALAAAMPRSREQGVFWLYRLLEGDPYRDARSVRRLAGAAWLATDCETATTMLLKHARLEDAALYARACGDPRTEYAALFAQGRFEDAARLDVPAERGLALLPHVSTLIAAGQWTRAADRVHERAEAARAEQGDGASRVRHLRCLEELLRSSGGDLDAERRLRALDAEEPGRCTPMLAELAPPGERRRLLQGATGTSHVTDLLRWAAGLSEAAWEPEYAEHILAEPDDYGAARAAHLAWLVSSERSAWEGLAPAHAAQLLRWHAVAQVFDGQAEAAVATARAAVAATAADATEPRFLRFLPAAAALYTPAIELAPGLDLDLEYGRDARVMDIYFARLMLRGAKGHYEPRHDEVYRGALAAARQGDGQALANYMASRYAHWEDSDILAVLPRIQTGREAVAHQLTWLTRFRFEPFSYEPAAVWQLAIHAVVRREGMKLAGVPEEAARWDEIYRRFDGVLDDRRRLVALMLWED